MRRATDRRIVLLLAGAAAVAATSDLVAAYTIDIHGTVMFEGDAVIPEGYLEVYLDDPALRDDARRRASRTRFNSNGRSKTIAFSLPLPTSATTSPTLQIIARLERKDGWLVARGSARFEMGSPVNLTLHTVVY